MAVWQLNRLLLRGVGKVKTEGSLGRTTLNLLKPWRAICASVRLAPRRLVRRLALAPRMSRGGSRT